jgi:hypothetical protein
MVGSAAVRAARGEQTRAMNGRAILLGAVLGLAAAPGAAAQEPPPGDGGTTVGGSVPSYLELVLGTPATALAAFPKPRSYSMRFDAVVTATDSRTLLTLADGDTASGARRGHLSSGSRRLPLPLRAAVGSTALQSLDASIDPLLARWTGAIARRKATVHLRQTVRRRASGTYHKLVLVTVASETP